MSQAHPQSPPQPDDPGDRTPRVDFSGGLAAHVAERRSESLEAAARVATADLGTDEGDGRHG